MSIYTNVPIDLAFLKATGLSVPRGHAALREFLASDAFLAKLTEALVELEESKLDPLCISDQCDHPPAECPENGIGCGDAAALRDELLK